MSKSSETSDDPSPDLAWGAKPLQVDFTPIGGALAWQVRWKCEFRISERSEFGEQGPSAEQGAEPNKFADPLHAPWLALNFSSTWTMDEVGFTDRKIAGYVQIAQIRGPDGDPNLDRTADRVRDHLAFIVPFGFRRKSSQFTESADRARLDFEIHDEELRSGPFPEGIANASLDYAIATGGSADGSARAALQGWVEVVAGKPISIGLDRLIAIAADKLAQLRSEGVAAFPSRLKVSRDLFGRRVHLDLEIQIATCLSSAISTAGLWSPIPGTDETIWRASMSQAWSTRGVAGLASSLADGAIVDVVDRPTTEFQIEGTREPLQPIAESAPGLSVLFAAPAPQTSWMDYALSIEIARRENLSLHRLSQEVLYGPDEGGIGLPFSAPAPAFVRETHGEPVQQVTLAGHATRIGFTPSPPILRSISNREVCERERKETLRTIGSFCGLPAIRLDWNIVYDVAGYLAQRQPPPLTPAIGQIDL